MKALQTVEDIKSLSKRATDLIDTADPYLKVSVRGSNFKVFDQEKLNKVAELMPEINRVTSAFGKKNSQSTGKLMSLTITAQSPYRWLRQCLSELERRRSALRESLFRLRKDKLTLDKLEQLRKNKHNELDLALLETEIQEKSCQIADVILYVEGCLKEIASFQSAYYEIKDSHNIPDNWDEEDFEKAEVEEHVKTVFLHCYRDLLGPGRPGMGTMEYSQQWGIDPLLMTNETTKFISQNNKVLNSGQTDINKSLYRWLDAMYEKYGDCYKNAMKRVGLQNLITKDYVYKEN
ncbi:MAG: hypothetical protein ACW99J_16145 [Candidatus Thorarchaeota archaeon]|jgi:hypothetical protein